MDFSNSLGPILARASASSVKKVHVFSDQRSPISMAVIYENFISRMRFAKDFFLPLIAAGMRSKFCRPASGRVPGKVLWSAFCE